MTQRTVRVLGLAFVLLLGIGLAGTAAADHTADPSSVTVAGSFQQELGCPGDWQPECSVTDMTEEDGVWQYSATIPAGEGWWKAALNGTWDESYPGGDRYFNLGGSTLVKFYYSHETHWATSSQNSRIITAAGDFQSALGCAGDWQPECLLSWLQDPDGDNTYVFVTEDIPAGNYVTKAVNNENWGNGSYPGGNLAFNVPNDCSTTTFTFVGGTDTYSVNSVAGECGHTLDNNVEYDGLGHNSHDTLYRVPFGAVTPGTEIILRFRTYHNDVESVRARVWDATANGQFFVNFEKVAQDISCYDEAQPNETCDFWQASLTPAQPTTLFYRFIITDGSATANYEDDEFRDGGWGEARSGYNDWGYVIQVYDAGYTAVSWLQNGVMYQIFPDRFRNGRANNDPKTNEPRYGWPSEALDRIIKKSWNDLPEGYCRYYVNPAQPCNEGPRGRDYFGGDLRGVQQRLNYLKDLGVTVIYFNPIFDAASNHAYDTQDYYTIDPFFGTNKEFDQFVKAAKKSGIKVVLDGVFNHVSSDSKYFDRYGHFATVGACESVTSPYRTWFTFFAEANGPCAGPGGPNTMNYNSWWGFDSLPVLDKNNEEVQNLFYGGPNSVGRYWLKKGAAGWRLDVMSDLSFPDEFWREFRVAVKTQNKDAAIIGEAWKKFEILPKTLGDQADTAMGYRFRNAILGFFGTVDDKGFNDDGESNQPPSLFANKLISIREDNPDASYYTMMNILGSHDTARIMWLLTPGERNREDREFNAANVTAGKNLLKLAAVVQMTTPGTPTIYYGDEIAMTGDDDPDDRRAFPWNSNGVYRNGGDSNLWAHYKKLVSLRKTHNVFRHGELSFLLTDDANRTLAYLMRVHGALGIVAINRSESPQTLVIEAQGRIPNNAWFNDVLKTVPGNIYASNGTVTLQMPPLSAAILMPLGGQDLIPPGTVNLSATAGQGEVTLNWNALSQVPHYRVYRSPLTGGGYEYLGQVAGTQYVDTNVVNGMTYYYVVTAVDAAGNEGKHSNEAMATPAYQIGYTRIAWPPTLNPVINVNGTDTVYGQVYVEGVTDQAGDPGQIRAEVGFGPDGSDPSAWTNWWPMTHNAGCGGCGNNYEYMGKMVPEVVGTFDYLVRFSTNNGQSWTYGDVDGWWPDPGQSQTNDPGAMVVNASADTTAPATPANLMVIAQSPEGIELEWDAVVDPTLHGYEVLRGNASGGPYVEIAETSATDYTDTNIVEDASYFYVVRAVDTSFNRSGNSNEVQGTAERRTVSVVFTVTVPATTDGTGKIVNIAGSLDALGTGLPSWNPGQTPLSRVDATHWTITLTGKEGTYIEYKYALGNGDFDWTYGEKSNACVEILNRTLTLQYGLTGTQLVNDTVANWRNVAPCGN